MHRHLLLIFHIYLFEEIKDGVNMTCTCGRCIGGIVSPRMAYRVMKSAQASAELLSDTMPEFHGAAGTARWVLHLVLDVWKMRLAPR